MIGKPVYRPSAKAVGCSLAGGIFLWLLIWYLLALRVPIWLTH